jgi:hypothetical protein
MRNYKGLVIPPRWPRTNEDIEESQKNYCCKTNCGQGGAAACPPCLFYIENIVLFEEWYLGKNKTKSGIGKT